ncbi:hypothetical protein [Micromonospora sp. CB01531]|uniref:hypothetical protein n=1 Tax=Micromonospora sp. CB01531 TaxID=1718947 RepID=UPI00093DB3B6|nr:hypothetical protein [Micromonospora sp. CB01531]OKI54529.1 hypothetical protein A6A27_31890 [Micromonospora sp. CB01531]
MQTIRPIAERIDVPFEDIKRQAARDYGVSIDNLAITVHEGHGVHTHDKDCRLIAGKCYSHHDDSDWIVFVIYDGFHRADYGVIDGSFSLWAD